MKKIKVDWFAKVLLVVIVVCLLTIITQNDINQPTVAKADEDTLKQPRYITIPESSVIIFDTQEGTAYYIDRDIDTAKYKLEEIE